MHAPPPTHVGIFDAKTRLSDLVERVRSGESFLVTKHDVPVAACPSCCFDDEAGAAEDIDRLAAMASMVVPGCLLSEVANALVSGARRGRMPQERALRMLEAMLDVRWVPDPDPRDTARTAAGLAIRHALTACDASDLAIAKRLPCALVTEDAALARAANDEGVSVASLCG